jgi:hypothetical protein
MTEQPQSENNRNVLRFQDPFEWYQISTVLKSIGKCAEELHLEPKDLVHIGGIAIFYRALRVFGPSVVMNFRGTHDMDVVSFNQGVINRVLDRAIRNSPDGLMAGYSVRRSHLPDKKSIYLHLEPKGISRLGVSTGFEMDIYECDSGNVRFNDRVLTKEKIVEDPPEKLDLPSHWGLVTVPSLQDALAIKMDIIDYSKMGLRPKDDLDILMIYKICNEMSIPFEDLVVSIQRTSTSRKSTLAKLRTLRNLFIHPKRSLPYLSSDYQFLPTTAEIQVGLRMLRDVYNQYETAA